MITKVITGGFDGLSRALGRLAAAEPIIVAAGCLASEAIVRKNVESTYGDEAVLAPLAQVTRDERARLGFSESEPLLRDGSLLRSAVESTHTATTASVGTPELVNLFHEVGYINRGTSVPPRSVFKISALASEHEVIEAFEIEIGLALK